MDTITREKQQKMISGLQDEMIPTYRIQDLRDSITISKNQGKDKVLFLIDLLEKQINEANGQILKRINKIKSFGTID